MFRTSQNMIAYPAIKCYQTRLYNNINQEPLEIVLVNLIYPAKLPD